MIKDSMFQVFYHIYAKQMNKNTLYGNMLEIPLTQISDTTVYDYTDCNIPSIEYNQLSYNIFHEKFLLKNVPCIIKNVSSSWECTKKWIVGNRINYNYFKEHYGDLIAPVANCNDIDYNAQKKINMKVSDYIQYLEQDVKEELLYLKDWHLRRLKPNDGFYDVPMIFASDWLNELAIDNNEDDFMFVYIGPKNSWTPLHVDVYSSYSWSVNIIGQKQWVIFPPGEEEKLKDSYGNLPLLFDPTKYDVIKYFEVIQEQGDAIFVPSGWHHQVTNSLDTISINHNWANACNIELVWNALNSTLLCVENEIIEYKDTPEFTMQCQLILKSLFGIDFPAFVKCICHIAKKRLTQLQGAISKSFNKYILGKNHILFDLQYILKIMNIIYDHSLFANKLLPQDIEDDFIDIKYRITLVNQ